MIGWLIGSLAVLAFLLIALGIAFFCGAFWTLTALSGRSPTSKRIPSMRQRFLDAHFTAVYAASLLTLAALAVLVGVALWRMT